MKKLRALIQYAVLPCRMNEDGEAEIMLLTSRETGRWVIPKGWPMKGLKPREVAEREAFEESGLVGQILGTRPIGAFCYEKQMRTKGRLCEVRVFLFRVDRQLEDWPEKAERQTRWFEPAEAAILVIEDGLAQLLQQLAGLPHGVVQSLLDDVV